MTDSETNLRTVRLRVGKEASLRREESEEAKKREAAKEEKTTMELELEERVDELERDNRALAFELKEALRDADVLRANQNEQKPTLEGANDREEMFLETRLANLEDRMEVRGRSISTKILLGEDKCWGDWCYPRNGGHQCKTSPQPPPPIQHCSRISDKGHQLGRYLPPVQTFKLLHSHLISKKKALE